MLPGFILYCPQSQGINLVTLCMLRRVRYSPPMTGSTRVRLSVVLLINNFHYWLVESKKTMFVVKRSFIVKYKLLCHENSFLY